MMVVVLLLVSLAYNICLLVVYKAGMMFILCTVLVMLKMLKIILFSGILKFENVCDGHHISLLD